MIWSSMYQKHHTYPGKPFGFFRTLLGFFVYTVWKTSLSQKGIEHIAYNLTLV